MSSVQRPHDTHNGKRMLLNHPGPGDPDEQTPYSSYLRSEVLHTLQMPLSDSAAEPAFMVNAQVMELYFGLIVHEMRTAQGELRSQRLDRATATLRRTAAHFRALNGNWLSLSWMTPVDFGPIQRGIAEVHGRRQFSALQSWMFRWMAILLGSRSTDGLVSLEGTPTRLRELREALGHPTLYDDVLGLLAQNGYLIPVACLQRDFAAPYAPHPAVGEVWRMVYQDPAEYEEFFALGETLADIAEEFTTWKYRHLMSVRRTFGNRDGYFGEPTVAWLSPTLDEIPFPELWTARAAVE
ncbi:tryptophan 2,3-dioxygenase [Pseudonocardia alaniniphila]|uniref:Tryptophan 2,3-dioxygenase family protein n=1 Tax=Pseudonocardia alaniniphila TaxID=75291 RepID=A0ABS9TGK9_9PSEU|nr:tryptophan 2,3-dioxygenase family protein [Pseudonocardia alaniniphila]MCH6167677.1 tryptophan 2,3-dioxygenase family protein [Pseudonocardia alaniniphila]